MRYTERDLRGRGHRFRVVNGTGYTVLTTTYLDRALRKAREDGINWVQWLEPDTKDWINVTAHGEDELLPRSMWRVALW